MYLRKLEVKVRAYADQGWATLTASSFGSLCRKAAKALRIEADLKHRYTLPYSQVHGVLAVLSSGSFREIS